MFWIVYSLKQNNSKTFFIHDIFINNKSQFNQTQNKIAMINQLQLTSKKKQQAKVSGAWIILKEIKLKLIHYGF